MSKPVRVRFFNLSGQYVHTFTFELSDVEIAYRGPHLAKTLITCHIAKLGHFDKHQNALVEFEATGKGQDWLVSHEDFVNALKMQASAPAPNVGQDTRLNNAPVAATAADSKDLFQPTEIYASTSVPSLERAVEKLRTDGVVWDVALRERSQRAVVRFVNKDNNDVAYYATPLLMVLNKPQPWTNDQDEFVKINPEGAIRFTRVETLNEACRILKERNEPVVDILGLNKSEDICYFMNEKHEDVAYYVRAMKSLTIHPEPRAWGTQALLTHYRINYPFFMTRDDAVTPQANKLAWASTPSL